MGQSEPGKVEIGRAPGNWTAGLGNGLFVLLVLSSVVAALGLVFFVGPLVLGAARFPSVLENAGVILTLDSARIASLGGGADHGASAVAGFGLILAVSGLALALVFRLLLAFYNKACRRTLSVSPLLPVKAMQFILCEEGVYVKDVRRPYLKGDHYRLLPWSSLAIDRSDEEGRRIGLISRDSVLILEAQAGDSESRDSGLGDYYGEMRAIIEQRIPKRQVKSARREWWRLGVLAGLCLAVLLAHSSAAAHFERISQGKVNDQACDVCSRSFKTSISINIPTIDPTAQLRYWEARSRYGNVYGSQGFVPPSPPPPAYRTQIIPLPGPHGTPYYVVRDGQTVHEYCEEHGLLYRMIHPRESLQSLMGLAKKSGWTKAALSEGIVACIWLSVAAIVLAAGFPHHKRQVRLKQ